MNTEKLKNAAFLAAACYHNTEDNPEYNKSFYDGFITGVRWLMAQPILNKLTDEEKEKIREEFWKAMRHWVTINEARGHSRTAAALTSIFGEDLFTSKDVHQTESNITLKN